MGCVTAACLAKAGHEVIGVDVNPDKVAMISGGKSPVIQPGLADLIDHVVRHGRLWGTASADEAVQHSEVAMIYVGTPSGRNGKIDTTAIERVAENIGRALKHRQGLFTIALRSTVLPGTTESVLARVLRTCLREAFEGRVALVVNPEFMREGSSIADFEHPPMTLVGCAHEATAGQMRVLYEKVEAPFLRTSIQVAGMTKYVSKGFHALKIAIATWRHRGSGHRLACHRRASSRINRSSARSPSTGGLVALAVWFLTVRRSSGGIAFDFLHRLARRQCAAAGV